MFWVLLLTIASSTAEHAYVTQAGPFRDKAACEAAAAEWLKQFADMKSRIKWRTADASALCVRQ